MKSSQVCASKQRICKPVPLLEPQHRLVGDDTLREELLAATGRVLNSGRYILGPEIAKLEALLADLLQVPWSVLVHSGTDALLMAMEALDIGSGDQVVLPAFTFFASASTVVRRGARPRLVDICPGCFCLSPHLVEDVCHELTRAIMPVHLFGQTAAMEPIERLARRKQVAVIEDAAQAFGARDSGGFVGALGTLGCYSFFPSKNLAAFGDGGLVVGRDPALRDRLEALRVHGSRANYSHALIGGNFRLDALQAALLAPAVTRLPAELNHRRALAELYTDGFESSGLAQSHPCDCHAERCVPSSPFAAPLGLPAVRSPQIASSHTFNQYVIRLRPPGLRDHVLSRLRAKNIGCAIYYPKTLAEQPALAHLGYRPRDFPQAHEASQQVLALPIAPSVSLAQGQHVLETVLEAITSYRRTDRGSFVVPSATC